MEKLNDIIWVIIGILFGLPLLGVSTGVWGNWLIALGFLVVGIKGLTGK